MTTQRDEQRNATRRAILQAALQEFVEKGFHGASTRSISRRARVSSGLIFHHFETKEALYEALIRLAMERLVDDTPATDPIAWLTATAERVLSIAASGDELALIFPFMSEAERRQGITPEIDRIFRERATFASTIALMERGQRGGTIRDGNPAALSTAFWAAILGIADDLALNPGTPCPEVTWMIDIVRKDRTS